MIKTPIVSSEVCRLCLQPDERLTNIFNDLEPSQLEQTNLSSKIMACVSVKISPTDQGPRKICSICMDNVNRWYQFNEDCKAVDSFLQKYLQEITEKNDTPPKVDDLTNAICVQNYPKEMTAKNNTSPKVDDLTNAICVQNYPKEMTAKNDTPPKVADVTNAICENSLFNEFSLSSFDGELNLKANISSILDVYLDGKTPQIDDETIRSIDCSTTVAVDTSSVTIPAEPMIIQSNVPDPVRNKSPKKRRQGYNCELCDSTFIRFNSLLKHDNTMHLNISRDFSCHTCGRIFISQSRLKIHQYSHREKNHACAICNKSFSSAKSLEAHCRLHRVQCKRKAIDTSNNTITAKPVIKLPNFSELLKNKSQKKRRQGYCCELCDSIFIRFDSLLKHDDTMHLNISREFSCHTCGRLFISLSRLKIHEYSHREKKHACPVCDKLFWSAKSLGRHSRLHSRLYYRGRIFKTSSRKIASEPIIITPDFPKLDGNKSPKKLSEEYKCELCGCIFIEFDSLLKHDDTVHLNVFRRFSCQTCGRLFISEGRLKTHQYSHRTEMHASVVSDELFLPAKLPDVHIGLHSSQYESKTVDMSSVSIAAEPVITVPDVRELDGNKSPKRCLKGYSCELCDSTFIRFDSLLKHDDAMHPNIFREFSCQTCGRLFISRSRLKVHEYSHREKTHLCPVCKKLFSSAKSLEVHSRLHSGQYKCEICEYVATSKSYLERHSLKHTGNETVHQCEQCSMSFTLRSSLIRHERTHLKQEGKVYKCHVCSFVTGRRCDLRAHMAVHNANNVEYKCDLCLKTYKSERTLRAHLARHKEAQFICDVCDKKFHLKSELSEHAETHSNEKRFPCFHCGKKFSFRSTLITHLKSNVPRVRSDIAMI